MNVFLMQNSIVRPLGRDMQNVLIGFVGEHEARTFFVRTRDDLSGYTVGLVIDDVDCGAMTKAPMPDGSIMLSLTLTSDMLGKGGDKVCQLLMTKDTIVRKSSQFRAYVGASNDINSTAPDSATIIIISEKITELVHEAALNAIAEVQEVIDSIPADYSELSDQVDQNTEDIGGLKADLGAMNTATSGDVGKALKVKTVTNGNVTEWEFGETGSGDAEALETRVEKIENVEPTYLLEGVEWEFGGISGGNNSTADHNRIRTVGYITVPGGLTVIPFELSNGVYIGVHALTSAKAFISDSGWQNASNYAYTVPENTAFIRIVLHNKSNSNMSDTSESDNVFVDLSPQFIKDFLALENALDSKYDKSETYSKEEVEDLAGITEVDLLDGIEWELGSLHLNTGAETTSTTAIRTPYIPLLTSSMWIDVSISEKTYKMFFYNAEHERISDGISFSGSGWFDTNLKFVNHKIPDGTAYIRFVINNATNPTEGASLTAIGRTVSSMLNKEVANVIGKPVIFDRYGAYSAPVTDGTTENDIVFNNFSFLDAGTNSKSARINLKAGDVLIISGTGHSSNRSLYKAFDATTGLLIDYATASNRPNSNPQFIRYDVDTHIYISALIRYPYYAVVVESGSVMYKTFSAMPGFNAPIIDLNDVQSTVYEMKMLKRPHYNGRTPAVFVHFSDIHSDVVNTKRIVDFITDSRVSGYIDDTICSGDIVHSTVADPNPFDSVFGAENILCVPGNHDAGDSTTLQQVYEKLYTGKIDNWGVTQPEGGAASYLGYFYKDYSTYKLRVIFLDSNHDSAYITAQASWLADVLESARTADLSVMCVSHYFFNIETLKYVDCGFSPGYHWVGGAFARINDAFVAAVETFITNGGDFVCWLGGHGHQDYVITNAAGTQLEIGVSCSKPSLDTGDDIREMGTKSQDCINVMSIDTYCKRISILRLGVDRSRLMVSKKHLCLDYANRSVIWSD